MRKLIEAAESDNQTIRMTAMVLLLLLGCLSLGLSVALIVIAWRIHPILVALSVALLVRKLYRFATHEGAPR